MFKLSALNDTKENGSSLDKPTKDTKEALEAQAFKLYNEALRLQQIDRKDEAVKVYEELLITPLIVESATTLVNKHNEATEHPLKDPGLILKYSAHKNVASICASNGDSHRAMENYLQAVMLDTSDVTLWYKIGILAAKLSNLCLSRRALTQGLECNPSHWPCLDSLITVCYSILDYENCLRWISFALKKDSYYKKGIVFRRKIIRECPHLKKNFDHIFQNCGSEVFEMEVCEEDANEFLKEAFNMRANCSKLCSPSQIPVITLKTPLISLSWSSLGQSLIETFTYIDSQDEPASVTSPIDMKVFKGEDLELHYNKISLHTTTDAMLEDLLPEEKVTDLGLKFDNLPTESPCNLAIAENNSGIATGVSAFADSSQLKKPLKRKKLPEKMLEQSRRSERRSSRMKHRHQSKSAEESCPSPELDFRHSLQQLLPKTLQIRQKSFRFDVDSDTNSQDSIAAESMENIDCILRGSGSNHCQDSQVGESVSSQSGFDCLVLGDHISNQAEFSGSVDPHEDPDSLCTDMPDRNQGEEAFVATTAKKIKIDPKLQTSPILGDSDTFSIRMGQVHTMEDDGNVNPTGLSDAQTSQSDCTDCTVQSKISRGKLEEKEVKAFIDTNNDTNTGILNLLLQFCKSIGKRSHAAWQRGLKEVFLRACDIVQPTLRIEPLSENDIDPKTQKSLAYYMLTHLECCLDKKYKRHSEDCKYSPNELERLDMRYIIHAAYQPEILELDSTPQYHFKNFILRFHWVRANYFFLKGDKKSVIGELTMCEKLCVENMEIKLHHLENHKTINSKLISTRINALKQSQMLEKIESLVELKQFSEALSILSSNLKPTAQYYQEMCKLSEESSCNFERPKLLTYTVKAAIGLDDTRTLLESLLKIILECVKQLNYFFAKKSTKERSFNRQYDKWQSLCILCCSTLASVYSKNAESLLLLETEDLALLTDSLITLNHHNLIHLPAKSHVAMKPSYVKMILTPWILLHNVTEFAERNSDMIPGGELPSSVSILVSAHDRFGEKGCCCLDNGRLVRMLLDRLLKHMKRYSENSPGGKDKLDTSFSDSRCISPEKKMKFRIHIEQCFHCLFGYPHKIAKSSPLIDHGSQSFPLVWQDCFMLYQYFKPRCLPAFDSYKANTMANEMAGLLVKIIKLVPEKIASKLQHAIKILDEYLKMNDVTKGAAFESICDQNNSLVLGDIYYLLADYYFKTNDMPQAGKYYMHDLCINPRRFDSWAALALVKYSILDQRIRMSLIKLYNQVTLKEESIMDYSCTALFCFRKAMEIEDSSTTLWIEFGTLAYWMHSYLSRQIKFKEHASEEEVAFLKKKMTDMLNQAERCFEFALGWDSDDVSSEEWLILYMLGKVQEKKREPPQKYLRNYSRAASLLYRKHAKYPKRIQFKSYQTDYAIEALEMYFRIHCSILKLVHHEINILNRYDDGEDQRTPLTREDFMVIIDTIEEAEGSNFVRRDCLPSHQFYDKMPDMNSKKPAMTVPKLAVRINENQTKLSMGSLVPDAIVSALSSQLPATSVCDDMEVEEVTGTQASTGDSIECGNQLHPVTPSHEDRGQDCSHSCVEKADNKLLFPLNEEERLTVCTKILKSCVSALHLCLGRLPQHYKAIYRLADLYWRCSPETQNASWSCDLLLGSTLPWQDLSHMPCQGLLSERNKTNVFNGVWKIPVDEIDRPGSFGYHLFRCIQLLLDVLLAKIDHKNLFYLHNMLNRTPDQGRRYLRDADRIFVCKKALSYCITALYKKISCLSISDNNSEERLHYLIDAAKICQQKQRVSDPVEDVLPNKQTELHKELLIMAYEKYILQLPPISTPLPNLDFIPAVVKVERILKFCQQHTGSFPPTPKSNLKSSQQFDFKLSDNPAKSNAVSCAGNKPTFSQSIDSHHNESSSEKPCNLTSEVKLSLKELTVASSSADTQNVASKDVISNVCTKDIVCSSSETLSFQKIIKTTSENTHHNSNIDNIYASDITCSKDSIPVLPESAKALPTDHKQVFRAKPELSISHNSDLESNEHRDETICDSSHSSRSETAMLNVFPLKVEQVRTIKTSSTNVISTGRAPILQNSISTRCETSGPYSRALTDNITEGLNATLTSASIVSPRAKVTTIVQGDKTYTKIVPIKRKSLSPSPRSAFTLRKNSDLNLHIHELKRESKGILGRSASLPERSNIPSHNIVHRTGSISEYTKQKLKSSILMKTSASLVKKPSITETEIEQILFDIESSQSEEEEDNEASFKPVTASTSELESTSYKPIDIPIAITPVAMSVAIKDEYEGSN